MNELDYLIIDALGRVLPKLSPQEMEVRLARRRRPMLMNPPREWCLAIRASDTRIRPPLAYMDPVRMNEMGAIATHVVVLEKKLLEGLAGPVQLRPYTEHRRVAEELGTRERRLCSRAKKGFFEVKRIQGLLGRRGNPVPCLYRVEEMDPNSRNNLPPDPIWGGMWKYGASVIGEDYRQEVRRRAAYMVVKGRLVFSGFRWECPACANLVRTLYFPLPRPTVSHALSLYPGGMELNPPGENLGTFACAACHGVSRSSWLTKGYWNRFISYVTDGLLYGHEVKRPAWPAVERRHRYARRPRKSANQERVLERLMEGKCCRMIADEMGLTKRRVYKHIHLLYHRYDVKSVAGLARKLGRVLPVHPDRGRPWKKAQQVMELLLAGRRGAEIAEQMGIGKGTVKHHVTRIFKRYGVKNVDALARAVGKPFPVRKPADWPRGTQVLELIVAGWKPYHIAREMGVSNWTVSRHLVALCRRFGVGTVEELKHVKTAEVRLKRGLGNEGPVIALTGG